MKVEPFFNASTLLLILFLSATICSAQKWERASIAQPSWHQRAFHRSVVFNKKMWLFNGKSNNSVVQTEVYSSQDGVTWSVATSSVPYEARTGFTPLVYNKKMWVIGGEIGC